MHCVPPCIFLTLPFYGDPPQFSPPSQIYNMDPQNVVYIYLFLNEGYPLMHWNKGSQMSWSINTGFILSVTMPRTLLYTQ